MARNIFSSIRDIFKGRNKFNYSFISRYGGEFTPYDTNGIDYLNKGYNFNSVVYSVISQQATKAAAVPFHIKKIDDKQSNRKLKDLYKATNYNLSPTQKIKKKQLELKAFDEEVMDMPLEKPNPNQSWTEFIALYKTFIPFGNVYIYKLMPEDGLNKGVPKAIYILPSHLIKIVTKDNADLLGIENPIKSYMLIDGDQTIEFKAENVIHIKLSNPNYSENGEHLYGQSRLRAALRNLQSSNLALDLNIKTLESGGGFGFFFGKNQALTEEQAKGFKERMKEMELNPSTLDKIAGSSVEIGYQRISLTADELKPFEYLVFDQKQICNVLGWNDKLLNSDEGAKYDNVDVFKKEAITGNVFPDLNLFSEAMENEYLPLYKGYENTKWIFDISELPEMQDDIKSLEEWAGSAVDRGGLNLDEYREVLNFPTTGLKEHQVYTTKYDVLTLEEAQDSSFNIDDNNQ